MRISFLPVAVLLFAVCGFAGTTTYDNFTGYNPYWHPLGYPNTSTYGETFTAPTNGDSALQNVGFYLAGPVIPGDIVLSAYIATWTGSHAGTLLFTSPSVDYPNTGNAELTFSTGGLALTPGASYVAFLSVSDYYGQSSGLSYISTVTELIPGSSFAYANNLGDFASLFSADWNSGLKPDWGFTATFTAGSSIPEPGTLALFGVGILALGAVRRRLKCLTTLTNGVRPGVDHSEFPFVAVSRVWFQSSEHRTMFRWLLFSA